VALIRARKKIIPPIKPAVMIIPRIFWIVFFMMQY